MNLSISTKNTPFSFRERKILPFHNKFLKAFFHFTYKILMRTFYRKNRRPPRLRGLEPSRPPPPPSDLQEIEAIEL